MAMDLPEPKIGDAVIRVNMAQLENILRGRQSHVVLDAPLRRGCMFLAVSDQVVASGQCATSQKMKSLAEWHRFFLQHQHRGESMPYRDTYISEVTEVRRLPQPQRLTNGPLKATWEPLRRGSLAAPRRPLDEEPADALTTAMLARRAHSIARAGGASSLASAFAAGAVTSVTSATTASTASSSSEQAAPAGGASSLAFAPGAVTSVTGATTASTASSSSEQVPPARTNVLKRPAACDLHRFFRRRPCE